MKERTKKILAGLFVVLIVIGTWSSLEIKVPHEIYRVGIVACQEHGGVDYISFHRAYIPSYQYEVSCNDGFGVSESDEGFKEIMRIVGDGQ